MNNLAENNTAMVSTTNNVGKDNEETMLPLESSPAHVAESNNDANLTLGLCGYKRCWHGWCSFPQVQCREWIFVFIASLVALILCDAATDVCGFVRASVFFDNYTHVDRRRIGINKYEDGNGECTSWRKGEDLDQVYDDDDYLWQVVRTFVGIASVVALLVVIALALATCVSYPKPPWKFMAYTLQMVWFLYSLSFMLFGSEVCQSFHGAPGDPINEAYKDCTFDVGAVLTLVGVLVWMPASLGVWLMAQNISRNSTTITHMTRESHDEIPAGPSYAERNPENRNEPPSNTPGTNLPSDETDKNRSLVGFILPWLILVVASVVTNATVIAVLQD